VTPGGRRGGCACLDYAESTPHLRVPAFARYEETVSLDLEATLAQPRVERSCRPVSGSSSSAQSKAALVVRNIRKSSQDKLISISPACTEYDCCP